MRSKMFYSIRFNCDTKRSFVRAPDEATARTVAQAIANHTRKPVDIFISDVLLAVLNPEYADTTGA